MEADPRKTRAAKRLLGAAALAIGMALAAAYAVQLRKDMTDFGVCYQAGQRIVRGETLYRPSDGHLQYKYAPVSAVLYAGLAWMPYEAAKAVWFAVMLGLLAGCFALSYRGLPSPRAAAWSTLALAFLILGKFIGREFELGQVNLLILFLILAALGALVRGRDVRAGLLWSASLFFKPYGLVFLPYFLLKKRAKAVAAGAAGLAAGLLLPAVYFGVQGNFRELREWAGTLSHSTPGLLEVGDNASLYAFLAKHLPGHPGWAAGIFAASAALLALLMLWTMKRARIDPPEKPEVLDFAFLLVLVPLLSPLGWYYNYLYGIPAVVLVVDRLALLSAPWKTAAVLDFLLIGATLRETLGRTVFRFYTHHSFVALNFLVILALLAHLRARRMA